MELEQQRKSIIQHNHLQNTDDVYTFYYDESNNIRRLYLTESGLNVHQTDNFVLAGIAHKGLGCEADFPALFDRLNLQKTTVDMKLKHIAKGSFLDMLKSKKLLAILTWLNEQSFYLHHFNLNIIYWSIVDILDSIIGELSQPFYVMHHMQLKSDFYELVMKDLEAFLKGLHDFNYPDVPEDKGDDFCRWLIFLVNENKSVLPKFNARVLCDLMRGSLKLNKLPFVSGFHGRELISDFSLFYWRNLYLFKNSRHVFDDEPQIESHLREQGFTCQGTPLSNFEFVRSHDFQAIQISDVVAGFLRKYFSYLKDSSDETVMIDKQALNLRQNDTLLALRALIDRSDGQSRGFFNVVTSQREQSRNNWFLHGEVTL